MPEKTVFRVFPGFRRPCLCPTQTEFSSWDQLSTAAHKEPYKSMAIHACASQLLTSSLRGRPVAKPTGNREAQLLGVTLEARVSHHAVFQDE